MTHETTGAVLTRLPLEMRSVEGGALRVYSREPGRLTIETEATAPAKVNANQLDRNAVMAVRDALNLWLEDLRGV
jgi:hypothetical protein